MLLENKTVNVYFKCFTKLIQSSDFERSVKVRLGHILVAN